MQDWLRELKRRLPETEVFFAEMDHQLGAAFEGLTSEHVSRFVLAPPLPPDREIFQVVREPGGGSLTCELLNVDTTYVVTIAWTRSGDSLRFWWAELPVGDIREDLAIRRNISVDVAPPLFAEVRNPVWPHLKVIFSSKEDLLKGGAQELLSACIDTWNTDGRNKGAIHNAGPMHRNTDDSFAITIDFGSASVESLSYLLGEVRKRYPIEKVVLDS